VNFSHEKEKGGKGGGKGGINFPSPRGTCVLLEKVNIKRKRKK